MDPNTDNYVLEGDNTMYATESGLVVPVVTRAGAEPDLTGQSEGATRISGVSIQHTPATKLWFGKVHNLAGYRSVPHHHGEADHQAFLERPFDEAPAAIHKRLHELGIAH